VTGTNSEFTTGVTQASSVMVWRSASRKTHVNSGVRYSNVISESENGQFTSESGTVNAGVRYNFTDNLSGSLSTSRTETEDDMGTVSVNNHEGNLHYQATPIEFRKFNYGWSSDLTAAQQVMDGVAQESGTMAVGHNIGRSWKIGRKGAFRMNADQRAFYTEYDSGTTDKYLQQGLRIGYSENDINVSEYVNASFNEERARGRGDNLSQQFNLQYSRQQRVSLRSSLTGSASYQQSHTKYDGVETDFDSVSATLGYALAKSYAFQTLSFKSNIRYALFNSSTEDGRSEYLWENVFRHTIGKLESSVTVLAQDVNDRPYRLILINIKRKF